MKSVKNLFSSEKLAYVVRRLTRVLRCEVLSETRRDRSTSMLRDKIKEPRITTMIGAMHSYVVCRENGVFVRFIRMSRIVYAFESAISKR